MVCDDVDSVPVAKVGIEPIPDSDLHSSCKSQVVVPRQTAYDPPPRLSWAWLHAAIAPMLEEYVPKSSVLVHPKVVSISAVLFFGRRACPCRPLTPPVKQVAKEEDSIRMPHRLEARIRPAQVQIRVLVRERVQRPRPAWIRMRVYELRVCNQDEPMGVCAFFLPSELAMPSSSNHTPHIAIPSPPTSPNCSSRPRH